MNDDKTARGIVTTIPERCKRCYTCVRECPARAIKVENGQAMVIEERCIACGNCSKYCEMGIDVRSYAMRGEPVKRASCVGCGLCAHVCPRGVLRLETKPTLPL